MFRVDMVSPLLLTRGASPSLDSGRISVCSTLLPGLLRVTDEAGDQNSHPKGGSCWVMLKKEHSAVAS